MALASSSSSVVRSARQLVNPVISSGNVSNRIPKAKRLVALPKTIRPYSAAAALAESSNQSSYQTSTFPSSSSSAASSSTIPSSSSSSRPSFSNSRSNQRYTRKPERKLTGREAQIFLSNLLGLEGDKQFSEELSLQILTHKSFRYSHNIRHFSSNDESEVGNESHNSRLSFIGRRSLSTFFTLFIHDSYLNSKDFKLDAIDFLKGKSLEDRLDNLRDTRNLGRLVASNWGLADVVRWDRNETSRESGDLKILGMAVESILGGIFTEFGSPAAQRAFHSMILPHYIPQLKDPRLIERVLSQKDQLDKSGRGIVLKA
ncbi:uncharacterized protein L201_007914 [Kwoniella dendrophila CBS 6074]|uniref:RNase III domain-containing protein n=1 Tax=Kwoniella dendrophila CBS 6074 TaxID=1295534 RepID=A0AAX4K5F9_9TREE